MQWDEKYPFLPLTHTDRQTHRTRTRIPFGIDQGHHQCKDWERIQEWARERSFDIYEPGLLVHPDYGELGSLKRCLVVADWTFFIRVGVFGWCGLGYGGFGGG